MNYDPSQPIAVFLGPSLDRSSAAQLLAANYYPPAHMGDIYRLLGSGVRLIVLIDGLFHQTASVWQRELLEALDNGIGVVGASSMGALRAAELHPYGMVGYGLIFEWYRDGQIEGDDEVALHHADAYLGFRPLSEPLVNIRYTIGQAVQQGCISPEQAGDFIEVARSTYYAERSYPALLATPLIKSWSPDTQAWLAQFVQHHAVNLKRQDAIGVLKYCAAQSDRRPETDDRSFPGPVDPGPPSPVPGPSSPELPLATKPRHQGRYYRLARYHRRGFLREDGSLVSGEAILAAAMQATELVKTLRPALSKAYFLRLWAQQRQIACPPDVLARFRERWLETCFQPLPEAARGTWNVPELTHTTDDENSPHPNPLPLGEGISGFPPSPFGRGDGGEGYLRKYLKAPFDTPLQLLPSGGQPSAIGGLSSWLSANGLTVREFEAELAQRALLDWLIEQGPGAFDLDFGFYELFVGAASSVPTSSLFNVQTFNVQTLFSEELRRQAVEACFLSAWAKDNGISCPPAYLEKFIQTWEEKCPVDRRVAWLEAANLSETTYLAALTGWAVAAWLIEQEPPYFGYTSWSFEVALLKELQMTGQAGRIIVNGELPIVNCE